MEGREARSWTDSLWVRWGAVVAAAGLVLLSPAPAGVTTASWRLLAVFAGTMAGLIAQPLPGGAIVLMGVCTLAATGTTTVEQAMAGY